MSRLTEFDDMGRLWRSENSSSGAMLCDISSQESPHALFLTSPSTSTFVLQDSVSQAPVFSAPAFVGVQRVVVDDIDGDGRRDLTLPRASRGPIIYGGYRGSCEYEGLRWFCFHWLAVEWSTHRASIGSGKLCRLQPSATSLCDAKRRDEIVSQSPGARRRGHCASACADRRVADRHRLWSKCLHRVAKAVRSSSGDCQV